ncbi:MULTISPECIES: DUF308 domain-containing protein [Halorussus]|uniref:DUF308 domain-containing protein n=1 Tax=Halorussus TaxID=1070314 RepID=UPI000E20E343|nr:MULTISPECIES: DUF308 domain-containing protein [Halorussus]NHN61458.1 DUF308 domain-containing protein [Halorussus sp. JP-T4]
MPNDPYTDDEYDDSYEELHGDEPARDQYTDETTDDTFFPSGVGSSSLYPSGWGLWPSGDAVDAEQDAYGDENLESAETDDDDGSWLDEGLIGTFIVVGAILFFFPEPTTSAVGVAMLAMGVMGWIVDWAMS